MADLTVAAGFARGLMELAVAKGADRAALAERSGIDPATLEDQDNRIPLSNYRALMKAGQVLADDPALALRYGEAVAIGELSIVGLIGQASESPMEALALVNRYASLTVEVELEGPDRLSLVMRDGALWLVDNRLNPNAFPELTEQAFARMVCDIRRFGVDRPIGALHVTHAEPAYRAVYDEIFRAPIVFDSPWNAIQIDQGLMDLRMAQQPRYMLGVLGGHADALLGELERSKLVGGRVQAVLARTLEAGPAGMEAVAAEMGLSRQSLYRKLKAEGFTFEGLLDDLRRRLALDWLGERKVSISQTAHRLGFSDRAAFSRAFKRWTGRNPGAARGKA